MNQAKLPPFSKDHPITRDELIILLHTAQQVKEYSFARRLSTSWLAVYPGDLEIQLNLAKACWLEGLRKQALIQAREICQVDPEYFQAQLFLGTIETQDNKTDVYGNIRALSPDPQYTPDIPESASVPPWAEKIFQAREFLEREQYEEAAALIQRVMGDMPNTALAGITHIRALVSNPDTPLPAVQDLARHYRGRWPESLVFSLILAYTYMESGQSQKGVDMIHRAATRDLTGQVAVRLWGENHPYQSLWPTALRAHLDLQIPGAVSAVFGWNQLPIGKQPQKTVREMPPTVKTTQPSETLRSVQEELENVARKLKKPSIAQSDGRYPVYVIFSTRRGLEKKYGPQTALLIQQEMESLSHAVREKQGWAALAICADDPADMAEFGLKPVSPDDAWALKLALTDLDAAFAVKGLMIGAVLIVGGDEIVPFHKLPNPLDDIDAEVPSDNPYSTRDENYFIPEWPVGRLPGGHGSDPGLLLSSLRKITRRHHDANPRNKPFWQRFIDQVRTFFVNQKKAQDSFGYAAEAWKEVSREIFQVIGSQQQLVTSPPFGKQTEIPIPMNQLGYYNLHGVEDDVDWFGQRDFRSTSTGPDYPVALRPADIRGETNVPKIAFTEACYGAHLAERTIDESIVLKMLSCGTQAVAGSTVTSYGSITAPLIAADLLAKYFWENLTGGQTCGQALQKAKISLAQRMHKRQGYLDGEDQKTLISFVLYGDPLSSLKTTQKELPGQLWRSKTPPPEVQTVCDRCSSPEGVTPDVLKKVKHIVKHYLPGMENALVSMSDEHIVCSGDEHSCPTSQLGTRGHPKIKPGRRVVTLKKEVETISKGVKSVHWHYARVTLDQQGKIVKLAVSR